MSRRRTARAAAVLAHDLEARLSALGVPAGRVSGEQVASAVVPLAGLVADAEAQAEKAARQRDRTQALADALLARTAARLAAPPPSVLETFDPSQWQPMRVVGGHALAAHGGLS